MNKDLDTENQLLSLTPFSYVSSGNFVSKYFDKELMPIIDAKYTSKCFAYSNDGMYLAIASNDGKIRFYKFNIQSLSNKHNIELLATLELGSELSNMIQIEFSPKGMFVVLYSRPIATSGHRQDNCKIFSIPKGNTIHMNDVLYSFYHDNPNNWAIQWSQDEQYFARLAPKGKQKYELHLYNLSNITKDPICKYQADGLASFEISKSINPTRIAVFIQESSGIPASVRLFNIPTFTTPVSMKSFFKADKVQLFWNKTGQSLLVLVQTDIDHSGKSYYGESRLCFLSGDGKFDCHVTLGDKDNGPVHDITWSPINNEFIVIHGFMPSKATLFDSKCQPIFEFGTAHRNHIRYNQQGNVICIAGFGNLSGHIDIWDRTKLTKLASFQSSGTTLCEWAPTGKHLVLATLSPRLRVDNGYKIVHYSSGYIVCQESLKELTSFEFNPLILANLELLGSFKPKVLSSSITEKNIATLISDTDSSGKSTSGLKVIQLKEGRDSNSPNGSAYIPPGLRGIKTTEKSVVGLVPKGKKDKGIKISMQDLTKKLDEISLLKKKQAVGIPLTIEQEKKIKEEKTLMDILKQNKN